MPCADSEGRARYDNRTAPDCPTVGVYGQSHSNPYIIFEGGVGADNEGYRGRPHPVLFAQSKEGLGNLGPPGRMPGPRGPAPRGVVLKRIPHIHPKGQSESQ